LANRSSSWRRSACPEAGRVPPSLRVWAAIVLLACQSAGAGSLARLRRFAADLESRGAYREAGLEYRRMLFFARTHADSMAAHRGWMRTADAAGDLRQADAQARILMAAEPDAAVRLRLEWESLERLVALSEIESARDRAYALLESAHGPDSIPVLRFLAALEIEEDQPEQARHWAERLASACPAAASALRDTLPPLLDAVPPKSVLWAGILSGIMPGLGQVYAGEPAGGLNSLLLNGLTGYGLAHGLAQARLADFVLYLALFERFYLGGIKVARARAEDADVAASKATRLRALDLVRSACREPGEVTFPELPRVVPGGEARFSHSEYPRLSGPPREARARQGG
jgi:hypothetical protein